MYWQREKDIEFLQREREILERERESVYVLVEREDLSENSCI